MRGGRSLLLSNDRRLGRLIECAPINPPLRLRCLFLLKGGFDLSKLRNVFAAFVVLSVFMVTPASQAQHLMPLTKPHVTGGGPGAINGGPYPPGYNVDGGLPLLYFGGPVISNVKAVVVLWGNNVDPRITTRIGSFYRSVTDSNYVTWLSPQYDTFRQAVNGLPGTNQKIGAGTFLGTFTIQPAVTQGTIDDTAIQAELQAQISGGHLPAQDADTLYMVYFPPGLTITAFGAASCQQFCAYHNFDGLPDPSISHIFYGVIPDISACFAGCESTPPNPPDFFDSVTTISGHEFEEAITDPFPTPGNTPGFPQAWNDANGYEIGDLCAFTDTFTYPLVINRANKLLSNPGQELFRVQSEWGNNTSGCTTRLWPGN
jgi:hypothetical protein